MPRTISRMPSLLNGVSQQDPALRLPSQGQSQINIEASPTEGLVRRRPLKLLDVLENDAGSLSNLAETKVHFMQRSSDAWDVALFKPDGTLEVFGQDGTQRTVWQQRRYRVAYEAGYNMDKFVDPGEEGTTYLPGYALNLDEEVDSSDLVTATPFYVDSPEYTETSTILVGAAEGESKGAAGDSVDVYAGASLLTTGTITYGLIGGGRALQVNLTSPLTKTQIASITKLTNTTQGFDTVVDVARNFLYPYRPSVSTTVSFHFYKHIDGPHGENGVQTGTVEIISVAPASAYANPEVDDADPLNWAVGTVVGEVHSSYYATCRTTASPSLIGYDNVGESPKDQYKCLTLNDYTFVLDTEQEVAKSGRTPESLPNQGLVWIEKAGTSYTYTLTVQVGDDEYKLEVQSKDSTATATAAHKSWNTDGVAEIFYHALLGERSGVTTTETGDDLGDPRAATTKVWKNATKAAYVYGGSGTDWNTFFTNLGRTTLLPATISVELKGSVLYFHSDDTEFTISCEDAVGDTAMSVAQHEVKALTDLPPIAPSGYVCKVLNSDDSKQDDYYVEFRTQDEDADEGDMLTGLWYETAAPGIDNELDSSTMPWTLIRAADGNFVFTPKEWDARQAGDADSAPDPSFVDNRITGIFFWKNRLGFSTSGGTALLSEVGKFFNFWPQTMTTLLDTDTIDADIGMLSADSLAGAAVLSEALVLFAPYQQYALRGGQVLSPATFGTNPTTLESVSKCQPVSTGSTIFFTADRGNYSVVKQYYVVNETGEHDAADITLHVPRYIEDNMRELAVSRTLNTLVGHASNEKLYVYRYLFRGRESIQACWSYYDYSKGSQDTAILGFAFMNESLYLVLFKDGDIVLCSQAFDASGDYLDDLLPADIYLDLCVDSSELSMSYDSEEDATTISGLPYDVTGDVKAVIKPTAATLASEATVESQTGSTIVCSGDLTGEDFWIGEAYTSEYIFSQAMARDRDQQAQPHGVTKVYNLIVHYDNSGEFDVRTEHTNRTASVYTRSIQDSSCTDFGTLRVPVSGDSDKVTVSIISDGIYPFAITSAEWELLYEYFGAES